MDATDLYAGINLPTSVYSKVPNGEVILSDVIHELTGTNLDKFAMFSTEATSLAGISKIDENEDIDDYPENKISTKVERMVAKVDVQQGAGLLPTSEVSGVQIEASSLKFALGAMNTKTYPMRRPNNEDPNYSGEPIYTGEFFYEFLKDQPEDGTPDFSYSNLNLSVFKDINSGAYDKDDREVKYTPENTSRKAIEGAATYASIQATFVPVIYHTWNSTDNIIEPKVNQTSTAKDWWVLMNEFGEYYFFEDEDEAKDALEDADVNFIAINVNGEDVTNPVLYKDGKCYYPVYFNGNTENDKGQTFRNDMYLVSVSKILELGNPNPGETDPGEEIVKQKTLIDVTIEVLHWNLKESDEELGK